MTSTDADRMSIPHVSGALNSSDPTSSDPTAPDPTAPDPTAEASYAIAVGSELLCARLFGTDNAELAGVPARRVGGFLTDFDSSESRAALSKADILITGWGTPLLTAEVLARAPRLRSIIHSGGATGHLFPDGVPAGLTISNAGAANAVPVAEYTLAMILLANKQVFRAQRLYREHREYLPRELTFADAGNFQRTVGVVSASRIGRRVMELLRPFDLDVLVYDPFVSDDDAHALAATAVTLDELVRRSDVVTIHTPVLPTTVGLIGAAELAAMRDGATLINTSRGVIVDQAALEAELVSGRLEAVIDVTEPEVLPIGSPLYELPNVVLTPHVAGSMGTELRRIGGHVAAELSRAARGDAFRYPEVLRSAS